MYCAPLVTAAAAAVVVCCLRRENGGQRIVTFLMYLSTPEEGGETVFPFADLKVNR
jgi:hypothetical protein